MTTHGHHPRNDLALAEAALFLAPQPLTRRGLAKILGGVAQAYVDQLLEDLKERFEDPSRGIELHIEDGRAQFRVKSAYVNEVAHLAPQHDIPRQELRTLAVIAYNHPMTQANLIKIRGNKGYKHVQELLERNLITSEPHGRTTLLHVTRDFLRHFGLNSVDEFRFHFPTAAEENAEALARGIQMDDDDEDGAVAHGESERLDIATDTMSTDDDSDTSAHELANPVHRENSDHSLTPSESENDTDDEPYIKPSEEVEHG
ncbi:SMC-Scp complex subunit ScpB [Candidatus Bipolaricaulota bacterium]|nr:SMC-Scp complex subunit ScpB [Candidatus Bipolaricaulota bacterium]